MWKNYFKFIKLRPGRVVTQQFGEIDFSSDKIPVETVKALYESDFPYLEITEEGKAELYGMKAPKLQPVTLPKTTIPKVQKRKL